MKKVIDIKGCLVKQDNLEITENEYESIVDTILDTIDKKGYSFGGGMCLLTEEQYIEELNNK